MNSIIPSSIIQHIVTRVSLIFLFQIVIINPLLGQNIEFLFHDGTQLTEAGSFFDNENSIASFTESNVTLSMQAMLDDNSANAQLNGGSEGFGINSNGANDYTQRIDNGNGIEAIVFSFNTSGILNTIDLRYIEESTNEAILSFDGGNQFNLNTETALSGQDDFTINEAFVAGQLISLYISPEAKANENFALESISIQIPENNAAILGIYCFILLFVSCRKFS